jgi:hypothetical protein
MHSRRTNASALVAQILWTMKGQPNGLSAIDAGCRAIAHHAHRNLAHDVVRGLTPRGLKQTKDGNTMVWHEHKKQNRRR